MIKTMQLDLDVPTSRHHIKYWLNLLQRHNLDIHPNLVSILKREASLLLPAPESEIVIWQIKPKEAKKNVCSKLNLVNPKQRLKDHIRQYHELGFVRQLASDKKYKLAPLSQGLWLADVLDPKLLLDLGIRKIVILSEALIDGNGNPWLLSLNIYDGHWLGLYPAGNGTHVNEEYDAFLSIRGS